MGLNVDLSDGDGQPDKLISDDESDEESNDEDEEVDEVDDF